MRNPCSSSSDSRVAVPGTAASSIRRQGTNLTTTTQIITLSPVEGHMTIDFKNLVVGRHESRVLFIWSLKEGVAMLGAFRGIKDGIEALLAREEITPAQRIIFEEFRAIAGKNNWDFTALSAQCASAV